jgi:hypothetical protein
VSAEHFVCRVGAGHKKTRPSAQYAADGLASPDLEIGLRHPVNALLPRESTGKCDPFHKRRKKAGANRPSRRFGGIQLALP